MFPIKLKKINLNFINELNLYTFMISGIFNAEDPLFFVSVIPMLKVWYIMSYNAMIYMNLKVWKCILKIKINCFYWWIHIDTFLFIKLILWINFSFTKIRRFLWEKSI